jgi:hypothetical protein
LDSNNKNEEHAMPRHRFQLNISAETYLHYYRGAARAVIVQAEDGRTIQLPANSFRPFVTADGISGRFELTLDANNKLVELRRL